MSVAGYSKRLEIKRNQQEQNETLARYKDWDDRLGNVLNEMLKELRMDNGNPAIVQAAGSINSARWAIVVEIETRYQKSNEAISNKPD